MRRRQRTCRTPTPRVEMGVTPRMRLEVRTLWLRPRCRDRSRNCGVHSPGPDICPERRSRPHPCSPNCPGRAGAHAHRPVLGRLGDPPGTILT